MSERANAQGIERILVALDASPQSLAALEIAVELSARLDAELIGIYVEDINLLRMAELPFAREVGHFSASIRQVDSYHIERHLRAQARWVQRTMGLVAEQRGVRWSFRVSRGLIPTELLAAALDVDLIVIGRSGWSRRRGLGSTAQVVVAQAPGRALIFNKGVRLGFPVTVAYDGSETGQKALAAANLVWLQGSLLTVLILADDVEEARRLQAEAHAQLRIPDQWTEYRWLQWIDADTLVRLVRLEGCGMLVMPVNGGKLPVELYINLMNQVECAVLLVR